MNGVKTSERMALNEITGQKKDSALQLYSKEAVQSFSNCRQASACKGLGIWPSRSLRARPAKISA